MDSRHLHSPHRGRFSRARCRRLFLELLEDRRILSADLSVDWQPPFARLDVNRDRAVTPIDALVIINELNQSGSPFSPPSAPERGPSVAHHDTSGDGFVSPADVLLVVNALNLDHEPPVIAAELWFDSESDSSTSAGFSLGLPTGSILVGAVSDDWTGVQTLMAQVDSRAPVELSVGVGGRFAFDPDLPVDGAAAGSHVVQFVALDARGQMSTFKMQLGSTFPAIDPGEGPAWTGGADAIAAASPISLIPSAPYDARPLSDLGDSGVRAEGEPPAALRPQTESFNAVRLNQYFTRIAFSGTTHHLVPNHPNGGHHLDVFPILAVFQNTSKVDIPKPFFRITRLDGPSCTDGGCKAIDGPAPIDDHIGNGLVPGSLVMGTGTKGSDILPSATEGLADDTPEMIRPGEKLVLNIGIDMARDHPPESFYFVVDIVNLPECTLRAAIEESNALPGPNTIVFNAAGQLSVNSTADHKDKVPGDRVCGTGNYLLPGDRSGVWSIPVGTSPDAPGLPLPVVSRSVTIDGTTQPGFTGTPLVEINGSSVIGVAKHGLEIQKERTTVRGLVINRFPGNGIQLSDAGDYAVIEGNYIGTDVSGAVSQANKASGVVLVNAQNSVIGGASDRSRNVISGNEGDGIQMTGLASRYNQVLGNYIGTDASGQQELGNRLDGIALSNAFSNTIGGTKGRNVIAGNGGHGVSITGLESQFTKVVGNYIGTNRDGSGKLPNGKHGVFIDDVPNNTIGGTTLASGNVISGNALNGVMITGVRAKKNVVAGNFIGTDFEGRLAGLGNAHDGVVLSKASENTVGGGTPDARNVISDNGFGSLMGAGLRIAAGASKNLVRYNWIGVEAEVPHRAGNRGPGVTIDNASQNELANNIVAGNYSDGVMIRGTGATGNILRTNRIGGAVPDRLGNDGRGVALLLGTSGNQIVASNEIIGNEESGILISFSDGNTVLGNYIGTPDGEIPLGNGGSGVEIQESGGNTIGGRSTADRNVVSANKGNGIHLLGAAASNNLVMGNLIGSDSSGSRPLPNDLHGVLIERAASNNRLGTDGNGTSDVSEANVISGNQGTGVRIAGEGTNGNLVSGNLIGATKSGTGPLPNGLDGVLIDAGARSNRIGTDGKGTTIAAEGNVISGNKHNGVRIAGEGTQLNVVAGNRIGTNASGTGPLPNERNGVRIEDKASKNRIGGSGDGTVASDKADGNTIAFNGVGYTANPLLGHGVVVASSTATGNSIRLNSIHSNKGRGIDLGDDSFTINDPGGDPDVGANNLQDYPVVRRVHSPTKITWMLDSTPNADFYLDFYSNTERDPSGFGEGKTYLKTVEARTDGTGRWLLDVNFPAGKSLISATATNKVTQDTSEFSMIDSDGDGLADEWERETRGIDIDQDGAIDHQLPGAKIDKLDIYVEIDFMDDPKLQPAKADIQQVESKFAARNINLHAWPAADADIDRDIPTAAWPNTKAVAGNTWPEFEAVKTSKFGSPTERSDAKTIAAKRLTHRYAVFASTYGGTTSSGLGELWGNDFIVSLGAANWSGGGGSADEKRGTFMHELGHTLGLMHGGDDNSLNSNGAQYNKPNYYSIMNYAWQVPHPAHKGWTLDYSSSVLAPLVESRLDETKGIGGPVGAEFPLGNHWAPTRVVPMNGPVDWDTGDGKAASNKAAVIDLTGDGDTHDTITGFNDWTAVPDFLYFLENKNYVPTNHGSGDGWGIVVNELSAIGQHTPDDARRSHGDIAVDYRGGLIPGSPGGAAGAHSSDRPTSKLPFTLAGPSFDQGLVGVSLRSHAATIPQPETPAASKRAVWDTYEQAVDTLFADDEWTDDDCLAGLRLG